MGSRGEFLGFRGDRPWKEGQRARKRCPQRRGAPASRKPLPPPCVSAPRAHLGLALGPSFPHPISWKPELRPQHQQVPSCAGWP